MYFIIFSENAKKQLKKLDKNLQIRIMGVLDRIKIRPQNHIKRLVNDFSYSLRVGDYRIILDIEKTKKLMIVLEIGHRRNIYKK